MKTRNTAFSKRILYLIAILLITFYLVPDDLYFSAENVEKLKKILKNASENGKSKILNEISKAYWNNTENPEKILEYGQKALKLAKKFNNTDQEIIALANIGFAYLTFYDFYKALEFAKKSLEMAENRKNKKVVLYALTVLAEIYDNIPDLKKSLEIYNRAKSLYEEINDKKGIAKCIHCIAGIYYSEGKTNIALEYYKEALRIYKEAGDIKKSIITMMYIARIDVQCGYPDKAFKKYLEAVKVSEENKLEYYAAIAYNQMGNLYAGISDYKKALKNYKKALALYNKNSVSRGIISAMDNIGGVYRELKQYDRALDYFYKALKLKLKIDPMGGFGASQILINIGDVFYKKKNYNKAMENFDKALVLARKYKELHVEADCYHHIGKIKLIRGNLNQALGHFENSLEISKKIKKAELIKNNYKFLSDIYSKYGNEKKSLEYFKLYSTLKDQIFNEESANKIAEMQTKFEMEKKEKEVEILKRDIEIQRLRMNRQRIIRNTLIVTVILFLIIVIQLFKKYRYLLAFWEKKHYIGHYKIMDKIASGGIGVIYKAHDITDKTRTFAVKVLRDEYFTDEIQKKRFKNEASIIDQFNHPNIVKIFERGEYEDHLYIVMELLDGKTLSEIIKEEGTLPIGTVLSIMGQVMDALVKIHRKKVIHRDLKPENIMIIKTLENPHFVKLLDFGLAKTKAFSRLTKPGIVLGTIFYLSPEQIIGSEITPASDVYSMGIICCEMLTGQKPFTAEIEDSIISQILNNEPLQPSRFRPDIPAKFNQLVMKMISKNPKDRPSAQVILNTLHQQLLQRNFMEIE